MSADTGTPSSPGGPVAPVEVFVALGSNLGDRDAHLRAGIRALRGIALGSTVAVSPVYETEPVGPPQGAYLNAVARLTTRLAPRALLEVLLAAESQSGRTRDPAEQNAPRTLDLDLLLYGAQQIDLPGLVVPHPRLSERAFALIPLADLAPALVHPVLGETIGALAEPYLGDPAVRPWRHSLAAL